MLTIGFPGFTAWFFYWTIASLFVRLIAYTLANRNENSALAKAMLFIYG